MKKTSSNIRDVALLAGVSPGSVSKVLNFSPDCRVSPEIRERILNAARELEYTPNVNAKRLFSKYSKVVALVVPPPVIGAGSAFADRHLCHILGGIEEELFHQGYRLMFISNRKVCGSSREFLELYTGKCLDGLIVWGAEADEAYWAEVNAREIPLVFLSSIPQSLEGKAHFISSDYRSAARAVTRKVLTAGHRKIIFLDGQSAQYVRKEIYRGMEEAFNDSGLISRDILTFKRKPFEGDFAPSFVREYMDSAERAGAIIALNYSSIVEIRNELANHAIYCPRDISLACFDGAAEEKDSSLVRCIPDDWQLGIRAAHILLSTIQKQGRSVVTELHAAAPTGGKSIAERKF